MGRRREKAGITAVSVLVGAGVAAVVVPIMVLAYARGNAILASGVDRAGAQRQAREVIALLDREVRTAGLDPSGALPALAVPAVQAADRDILEFIGDVDGDGVSDRTRYVFDPLRQMLSRASGRWAGAAFGPLGEAVPVGRGRVRRVEFGYLDDSGPPEILLGPLPLRAGNLARVKRIVFTVQATEGEGLATYTLTSSVRPRNL